MDIDDLPKEYYDLARIRSIQAGSNWEYRGTSVESEFIWTRTPEGGDFWEEVEKAVTDPELPIVPTESRKDIKSFEIAKIKRYVLKHFGSEIELLESNGYFYPRVMLPNGDTDLMYHVSDKSKIDTIRKTLIEIIQKYGQKN